MLQRLANIGQIIASATGVISLYLFYLQYNAGNAARISPGTSVQTHPQPQMSIFPIWALIASLLVFGLLQVLAALVRRRPVTSNGPQERTRSTARMESTPGYEFWPTRSAGPAISDLFRDTQEAWVAWVNGRAVRSTIYLREAHISRMIFVHPDDSEYVDVIAKSEGRPRDELSAEIRNITSEAQREGISVRWFRGAIIPFMIGDPNSASAWVKSDLAALYVEPVDRPSFRTRDPQIVRVFRTVYQQMWDDAVPPTLDKKPSITARAAELKEELEKRDLEIARLNRIIGDRDAHIALRKQGDDLVRAGNIFAQKVSSAKHDDVPNLWDEVLMWLRQVHNFADQPPLVCASDVIVGLGLEDAIDGRPSERLRELEAFIRAARPEDERQRLRTIIDQVCNRFLACLARLPF